MSTRIGSAEQVRLRRVSALQGMEVMSAVYAAHAFAPHAHDTYVIELVESGSVEFQCNGRRYLAEAGDIILLNPGDVHTGRPHGSGSLRYYCFYPSVEIMNRFHRHGYPGLQQSLRFDVPVVRDRGLSASFLRAHRRCALDAADADDLFGELIVRLKRYAAPRDFEQADACRTHASDPRLIQARRILGSRLEQRIALDEIAQAVRLSPFYLARRFRQAFGLPPHQFRLNARVAESRRLLHLGKSLAEVAMVTGFADQSHLSRNFKRIVGMTPGQFCHGLAAGG